MVWCALTKVEYGGVCNEYCLQSEVTFQYAAFDFVIVYSMHKYARPFTGLCHRYELQPYTNGSL